MVQTPLYIRNVFRIYQGNKFALDKEVDHPTFNLYLPYVSSLSKAHFDLL